MDGLQFDTLVKSLRPAFGRRRALAATLGGLLVNLPSLSRLGEAKRRGKRRRKKEKARRSRAEAKPLYSKEECDALCQGIPQQQSAWAKCKKACRNGQLEACQGDPDRLCMAAHGDSDFSFTCCGPADEQTCENGQCVDICIPADPNAACTGKCGDVDDGCGGTISCPNTCAPPLTCGGGKTPNVCGCTPEDPATLCAGKCGPVPDHCMLRKDTICGCPDGQFCCSETPQGGVCCTIGQETCVPGQGCQSLQPH